MDDASFDRRRDGLVYAGDLFDGGTGPEEVRACIGLLKAHDAQILWGNHDVAALLGYPIAHQDPWTVPEFQQLLQVEFDREDDRHWRLVVVVQGVFVTHAGISARCLDEDLLSMWGRPSGDEERLAAALNSQFEQAVRQQMTSGSRDEASLILGRHAPHRLRVFENSLARLALLPHATQVAGHSAPEIYDLDGQREVLRRAAFHIVDPSHQLRGASTGFRYAALSAGRVRVVEI